MQGTWQEGVGDEPAVWSCTQAMRVDSEATFESLHGLHIVHGLLLIISTGIYLHTLWGLHPLIWLFTCGAIANHQNLEDEVSLWSARLNFLNQGPPECPENNDGVLVNPNEWVTCEFTKLIIMIISVGECWRLQGCIWALLYPLCRWAARCIAHVHNVVRSFCMPPHI